MSSLRFSDLPSPLKYSKLSRPSPLKVFIVTSAVPVSNRDWFWYVGLTIITRANYLFIIFVVRLHYSTSTILN